MYALSALGVVSVYRGSGVVNFASGAMGMVGAFVFWVLADQHHWPAVPAILVGVAASGGLGVATYVLVMRPLRHRSNLVRVVATLGVLLTVQAGVGLIYTPAFEAVANPFLPQGPVSIFGAHVGADRLCLLGIALVLTLGATAVYTRTRFGLATTALAENATVAAATGWSPDMLAGVNWAVGGALAGIAGICLAPIVGISITLASILLLPSLAAAVAGAMRSFAAAAIVGVGIGVAQSVVSRYSTLAGFPDAVPFVAIILVLILRGAALPTRDTLQEIFPRVTSGRIPWILVGICSLTAAVALGGHLSLVWVGAVTTSLAVSLILLSLVVVVGYAGQLSLSQYAIAAAAGLVAARLSAAGVPFPLAALGAVAASIPVGILVGFPAVRTRGPSLAIATLGLSVVIIEMVLGNSELTGGYSGLALKDPKLFGIDLNPSVYPDRYALFSLACVVCCCIMVANLRRGRAGRRMLAVRANERAATAVGVSVRSAKLASFAIAAAISAVGGVLLTFLQPTALFNSYQVFDSVQAVAYAVVGSIGFGSGALVGSTLSTGGIGSQVFSFLGTNYASWLAFASGLLLLITVIRFPDGIAAYDVNLARRTRQALLRKLPARRPVVGHVGRHRGTSPSNHRDAPHAYVRTKASDESHTLDVRGISVRFGGLCAVDEASFSVNSAEILGIIGSNGAGKTTLIDAITGFVRLSGGQILLDGRDLAQLSATKRARLGVSRSFQSLELFEDLTVRENLLAGCDNEGSKYWFTDLFVPGRVELPPVAIDLVAQLKLAGDLDKLPSELSFGQRRLVAIARALVREPAVLLLDEPAAGLDIAERLELAQTIHGLAAYSGTAVVLIEHDLDLIRTVADRVVVMEFGRCIASGRPEEVLLDDRVIASYVGTVAREPELQ